MRTNSRWWARALTMVVLTATVSLSGRVEAQQTQLFPMAPIRRQRVPCDQEDPTYKIYKHQYFGYHPTAWRTFPAGWALPSPEGPDMEKSKRDFKPGGEREEPGTQPMEDEGPGPGPGPAPMPRRAPENLELPPEGPSPFDRPGGRVPNANPLPRGTTPPQTPAPGREADPFRDLNNPRGASLSPSRNVPAVRGDAATIDERTPELEPPANQPAQGSAYRSRGDGDGDRPAGDDRGPLLGLADADIVRSDAGAADDSTMTVDSAGAASSSAATAPAAQPRRRFFGNFFSNIGANWGRRTSQTE